MSHHDGLKIVIASASHRAHYVDWFKNALISQGVAGEVIAFEFRGTSATFASADRGLLLPAYDSPKYREEVLGWVRREAPDLLLSLNDYELKILSAGLADELRQLGCIVGSLGSESQDIVLDKYVMASALKVLNVPTPTTWLGSEIERARDENPSGDFIVKHRFGTGSTGLGWASASTLPATVLDAARSAREADGRLSPKGVEAVVIQERLTGDEFGVDGVFSLDGTGQLRGVLARRKERMRGGNTEAATTVAADRFVQRMSMLGDFLKPVGPIDVDFIDPHNGEPMIIDINPRFGGGYPFCHLAGADVPADIVRVLAGLDDEPSLLAYEIGLTSARREEFSILRDNARLWVGTRVEHRAQGFVDPTCTI